MSSRSAHVFHDQDVIIAWRTGCRRTVMTGTVRTLEAHVAPPAAVAHLQSTA